MKLKYSFENMELDDYVLAVPVGNDAQNFRAAIRLNSSAVEIFDMLKEETSEDEIVSALVKRHGDDRVEVAGFVHEFIEGLKKVAIIE